jgi:hypothetical protein
MSTPAMANESIQTMHTLNKLICKYIQAHQLNGQEIDNEKAHAIITNAYTAMKTVLGPYATDAIVLHRLNELIDDCQDLSVANLSIS